jgi:YbbR domain-containing protein
MEFLAFISERVRRFFTGSDEEKTNETDSPSFEKREKITAFGIAFLIALGLWIVVNLNRDFNVTLELPIQLTSVADDEIISSDVPDSVLVSVTGEGWNLISIYNNPPRILLNSQTGDEINVADQLRNQTTALNELNILQVEPSFISIETEPKDEKRVPLINRVTITTRDQFGVIGEPVLSPDSVQITGARSVLENITEWTTREISLNDVNERLEREIPLTETERGLIISPTSAKLSADVAEFTEAEVRVPIRTRDLPSGEAVTFNPSFVTVLFDVPIEQYSMVEGTRPFIAYVDYSVLQQDNTGRISPRIEVQNVNYHLRLRTFQPPRVSYFMVVSE